MNSHHCNHFSGVVWQELVWLDFHPSLGSSSHRGSEFGEGAEAHFSEHLLIIEPGASHSACMAHWKSNNLFYLNASQTPSECLSFEFKSICLTWIVTSKFVHVIVYILPQLRMLLHEKGIMLIWTDLTIKEIVKTTWLVKFCVVLWFEFECQTWIHQKGNTDPNNENTSL